MSHSHLKPRGRVVHIYAILCALTGLLGMGLSLMAHPDGRVYYLEQAALTYDGAVPVDMLATRVAAADAL